MKREKIVNHEEKLPQDFYKLISPFFSPGGFDKKFSIDKYHDLLSGYLMKGEFFLDEDRARLVVLRLFVETFSPGFPLHLKEFIENVEKCIIVHVLSRVDGNQKRAAEILGMKYTTLNEKIKRYKIRFRRAPL
ncbi:MAG: helix-turn-helix domain-containing protein [Candidatus Aminicenantales bacterium]